MRVVDIIRAIRDKLPVDPNDIRQFALDLGRGKVPDYQASAFCMAVFHQGLSNELTVALTLGMRDSGRVIEHPEAESARVDKHSTGGVGDKISLPLAPLVASCGLCVPMISGRGLGHTGGTLDKLESIPGFRIDLSIKRFTQLVAELGLSLIGQTNDLAPADRRLYNLRDVTATIESIPLITASILSKKLAEGIDSLVLDVKCGCGAFMKNEQQARLLAESLVRVGSGAGLNMSAVLTRMSAPLGRTIGNSLEVKESIEILKGVGPKDTTELTVTLGAEMLLLGGAAIDREQGKHAIHAAIDSGHGLEKFRALVEAQGGDARAIDNPEKHMPKSQSTTLVIASHGGFVSAVDSFALGMAAMKLGAGRQTVTDTIDPSVGIEVLANLGDNIEPGAPLARVHHNKDAASLFSEIAAAFDVAESRPDVTPLVIDKIAGQDLE